MRGLPHIGMRLRWVLAVGFAFLQTPLHGQSASANPHGSLPEGMDCAACHQTERWKPLRDPLPFKHNEATSFALLGSHETVACESCHVKLKFEISSECVDCHVDVHQGSFSSQCSDCHGTTSFSDVSADEIHNATRFPLDGAHAELSCESCHGSDKLGAFVVAETECTSCHESDYQSAHGAMAYPQTCETCHNTLAWEDGAAFEHVVASAGFDLLGSHKTLECIACHVEGSFAPLFPTSDQNDCATCHQTEFNQNHAGAGYPTDCATCHSVEAWGGATFNHPDLANGFDLVGAHEILPCSACHAPPPGFEPQFDPSGDADCLTCHRTDYNQEHGSAGFPTSCVDCHGI
ncbi:MAG: cytochrome c3 family protein, partial [Rhodothermales bacterium]